MNSKGRKAGQGFIFCLFIFLTFGGLALPPAGAQQASLPPQVIAYADTVVYNGKVLTADEQFTITEAVAIRDGKFLAVGKTDEILPMAGPNTHKIDLKGKTVIPGIIDLHQHPFTEGQLSYWAEKWMPNEPEWTNVQEAQEGIKRAVARAKPGEIVILPRNYIGPAREAEGGRVGEAICDAWTVEQKYRSNLPCAARQINANFCRLVSRAQIDSVSPNNPVIMVNIVNIGGHAANTKAYEALKPHLRDDKELFTAEGSSCVRSGGGDMQTEVPKDLIFFPPRLLQDYLLFWNDPLEEWMSAFRDASQGISAAGITLTKEHTAVQLLTGIRELWARGELTVRMRLPLPLTPLYSSNNSTLFPVGQDELAETLFRRMGNLSGIGDDMLRFTGVRAGGGGGSPLTGQSWMLEPRTRAYSNPMGRTPGPCGGPCYGEPIPPGWRAGRDAALIQAVRFGWDVSADHVIGDRAVREMLNNVEEGLKTQVVKIPNQRFHIGHTPFADPADIIRMKQLGVVPTIGGWHTWLPSTVDAAVMQWGTEKYDGMAAPMKSHINANLHPGLEGDVPGAIFWRMEKAITRKDDKYMRAWNRKEAVTRQEALWMSTLWSAQVLGEENKLGSIEPGKLADLVVVSKDYMTAPEDDLSEIETLMTVVGGKVVYEMAGGLQ